MSEIKPKSFRIDDETTEKFKQISSQLGGNQQETLAKLIESYEFQQWKMVFTEKIADIENFEKHSNILTRMFMGSLEENHCITEMVRTEFEAQLQSKDAIIKELQEQVKDTQQINQETIILHQELSNLKLQQEKQQTNFESIIKDKDDLNSALTDSCNHLKKELEQLNLTQEKIQEWKEKSDMLKNQNMELSKALELLSKQHALELEKLQLSLEKKFQEEKQKEIDKYQQKYFELLESLKKTPNNKKTVSSSKEKKEQ